MMTPQSTPLITHVGKIAEPFRNTARGRLHSTANHSDREGLQPS